MSPFYHLAAHRFAAPGSAQPGSAPSPQSPSALRSQGGTGRPGSHVPWGRYCEAEGSPVPSTWQSRPGSPVLLSIRKASPNTACNWGDIEHSRVPHPALVVSLRWCCPHGINDAHMWLQGREQSSIVTTVVAPGSLLSMANGPATGLVDPHWHRASPSGYLRALPHPCSLPLCATSSVPPVPTAVPSPGTSPAAPMSRG